MPGAPPNRDEPPLEAWPDALESLCSRGVHFRQVRVLRETASTQDAAVESGLGPGSIVTAGRQVSGRGRLGAAWQDTRGDGVAVTFVVEPLPPERLALAAAVAAAEAIRSLLPEDVAQRTGVKWPNDVVVLGASPRKVCGVLVERSDRAALIGVGINVLQAAFEGELQARAASLAMLGSTAGRLSTLLTLTERLDRWLGADVDRLAHGYRAMDLTVGLHLRFQTPQGPVEGTVMTCDPVAGLRVRTREGEVLLPAATTRVQPDGPTVRSTMGNP